MAQQTPKKAFTGAIAIIAGNVVTAGAFAQGCDVPFITAKRTAVGEEPTCIALGDIDGDGDTDAVTGNGRNQTVSVLLNDGVGGMSAVGLVPLAGLDVGLADFNGDGHLDIATDDGVALGNGDGTFQPAMPFTLDLGEANELAIADLDANGNLDLVFARREGSVVLLGNGDGTFGEPVAVTSQHCVDVAIADVDEDGDQDLLFAAFSDVIVVKNDGGAFAPPQAFSTDHGNTYHLNVGDINEDGHLDVFATNYNSRSGSVLLGDGTGTFGPPTIIDTVRTNFEVELIDANTDGHLDAITANAGGGDVGVLFGDGAGGFGTPRLYKVGLHVVDLAVADMNADGVLDIVAVDVEGDAFAILDGLGDGVFAAPQALVSRDEPTGAGLADLDGDGDIDIVMAQSRPDLLVTFLRDDTGYHGISSTTQKQSSGGDVQLLDIDNDGIDDAILERGFEIYKGVGDGTFGESMRTGYSRPQFADLNGDSRLDAVAIASIDGMVAILIADEDHVLIEADRLDLEAEHIRLADLDLDGDQDIVVLDQRNRELKVSLNDGSARFTEGPPIATDLVRLFVGDADGDGHPDAILASRELVLFLGDGAGGFTPPRALGGVGLGLTVAGVGVIDADADGIPDLVIATASSSTIFPANVLFRPGLGDAFFGPAETLLLGNSFQDLTIGDTNADGIDDLLVVDTDDSVSIILGQCSFTCRADLDGDGALSIFDFLAFFNAFDAGQPIADFDGDGELTIFDFLAFQNAFDAGCP
ncbi:MAG: FG-GAP-like repeat-containing protein [Phycisphaerales bacterium JB064]